LFAKISRRRSDDGL
jgi:hypothetical protein